MRSRRPLPGSIEVRRQSDQQVLGEVTSAGVLVKHVRGSRHLFRSLPGWCWDVSVLDQARQAGVQRVKIIDDESGTVYWTDLHSFSQHGMKFDFGHGDQIGLALKHWKAGAQPPVIGVQLNLFEGVAP